MIVEEAVHSLITKQDIKSQSREISLEDVRALKGVTCQCVWRLMRATEIIL